MTTPTVRRGSAILMQDYSSMSSARVCQALGLYKLKKVIEAQLSIAIGVSFLDHLLDLLVGNLLAQIVHDVFQLACADTALLSLSKTMKASRISSTESVSCSFEA